MRSNQLLRELCQSHPGMTNSIVPYRIPHKPLDIEEYSLEELERALNNKKNISYLKTQIEECGNSIFIKKVTIKRFLRKNFVLYKLYLLTIELNYQDEYARWVPCYHTNKKAVYGYSYEDITEKCGNLIKKRFDTNKKGFLNDDNSSISSHIKYYLEIMLKLQNVNCYFLPSEG